MRLFTAGAVAAVVLYTAGLVTALIRALRRYPG